MKVYHWRAWFTREFLIGYSLVTGLIAVGLLIGYVHYKKHVLTHIQTAARSSMEQAEQHIVNELNGVEQESEKLAKQLSIESSEKTLATLKKYVASSKALIAVGFINKADENGMAWVQQSLNVPVTQEKNLAFNTMSKQHAWKPDVFKKAQWNDTYTQQASDFVRIDYTVPLYRPGKKEADGILFITYSTEILTEHVFAIQIGNAGYSFVVLPRGQFIIHPFRNYVLNEKTIFEHAESEFDPGMLELSKKLKEKSSGEINYTNQKTGQNAWIIYKTIEKTAWVLAGIFFINELYREVEVPLRHFFFVVVIVFLFFLLGVTALITRVYTGTLMFLWHYVIIISCYFIITIGIIWQVTLQRTFIPLQEVVIVDKPTLDDYMREVKALRDKYHLVSAISIPTGVFVLRAQFTDTNNVDVAGILWQRYKKGIHDHIKRDFFLPDAVGGSSDIKEIYRIKNDEEEIVGWNFSSILMQYLDPKRYPLDSSYIKLRVWHVDFEKNVILEPDLASFSFTNPLLFPGLDPSVTLRAWNLQRSFFSYVINDYRTNFGIPDASVYDVMPEMSFNIGIQRKVFNVLISILFPLLGIAFMLFATLLAFTRDRDILQVSGFNTVAILAVTSAIFFTLISSHLNLRSNLAIQGLIYLDYFFFVLYSALFSISVISVIFAIERNLRFIQYQNSLIIKLLYWPFLTGSLMVITMLIFY
ncbi:MAG: hypothetical protein WD068_03065 [Candidatus Babeliales bacterium]